MPDLYVVTVYETYGSNPATFAIRAAADTLDGAKDVIEAETKRTGEAPVTWRDEFGGAIATSRKGLTYDIRPTRRTP